MIEMPFVNHQRHKFSAINLYASPRVSGDRVDNNVIPLCKYRVSVQASLCSNNFESNSIKTQYLRELKEKDGLIYMIKKMIQKRESDHLLKGRLKVLICVCMYNQSKDAINLTLSGIYKNLKHFREQGLSEGEIAVVLIQDGILKLVKDQKQRTFHNGRNSMVHFYEDLDRYEGKPKCDLIERINIILDETQNFDRKGMMGNVIRNKNIPPSIEKNIALVYQNLWKPSITMGPDGRDLDQDYELRIFSCFKHTNGTKLSSHLWFFEGFCRYYHPEFCVLLDVGTTPDQFGLVNLLKGFSAGKDVGGVTGFMSVDANFKSLQGGQQQEEQDNCCQKCFFSIEKAQEYEYISAHFIDKNAQSALGFLHVLPGAWSAYRYEALIKSERYEPNLLERSYFKMILNPDSESQGYEEANMYLAEDRILSLGIYCQMDSKYTLKYVPDAIAYTDPMKDHENLMKQRRRWINSSLFAFLYVLDNYYFSVMQSHHNCIRKYVSISISMFMAGLSFIFAYITPALYLFVLYSTVIQLGIPSSQKISGSNGMIAAAVCFIFVMIFFAAVAGALTGNNWTKSAHVISGAFAVFNFLMLALVFYNVIVVYSLMVDNPINPNSQFKSAKDIWQSPKMIVIIVCMATTLGSMVLILILHLPSHAKFVCKMISDWPSYLYYTGAYSQTMVIHGFCNVDDVSWGTKGSTDAHGGKAYEIQKVFFVSTWLFTNALIAFICIYADFILENESSNTGGGWVLVVVAILGASTMFFKALFAVCYHLFWLFCQRCCLKLLEGEPNRRQKVDDYWKTQFLKWRSDHQRRMHENNSYIARRI